MRRQTRPNAPRKLPIQARSRATVKALIEAAAQVLAARGYEAGTTDVVAERAGVSIGTLYQYFANKEALIAALIREHIDEILATVRLAMADCETASLEETVRALIRAAVAAHRINPALHKVLAEQAPREAYPSEAGDVSIALQAMIEERFRSRFPHVDRQRVRMVAFVVETTIEALTHRAVIETPDWLAHRALEREVEALLCPYIVEALR
jgi:AcrR family transcriptional regulator